MLGRYFYHQIFRKSIIAFGSVFNNIVVKRKVPGVKEQATLESFKVPIQYGPYQKYLAMIAAEPTPERQGVQITLPRMSFEIKGLSYDGSRKVSPTTFMKSLPTQGSVEEKKPVQYKQYMPVPYNLQVELSILSKNQDDGLQIIEQILPYFRPEFTTNVRLIPEMNVVVDTPVVLQDVSIEDTYEGDFDTRRALVYNLTFSVKAYLYGPVTNSGIIKRAVTNLFVDIPPGTPKTEQITITPSQYANGVPLFVPSGNTSLSVALDQISANSDYGFTVDINTDPFDLNGT